MPRPEDRRRAPRLTLGQANTFFSLTLLAFCRRDRCFDLFLQIGSAEARARLHWRKLDKAGDVLGDDLLRNLRAPDLMLELIPIVKRAVLGLVA